MNKSEHYKKQAQQAKHDAEALKHSTKALRQERMERFAETWLPKFKDRYTVEHIGDKFIIRTDDYGIIDFFPKANKFLIRKQNKWVKPGLKRLIDTLL